MLPELQQKDYRYQRRLQQSVVRQVVGGIAVTASIQESACVQEDDRFHGKDFLCANR